MIIWTVFAQPCGRANKVYPEKVDCSSLKIDTFSLLNKPVQKYFFLKYFLSRYMYVSVCVCQGQRTTYRSEFFPSFCYLDPVDLDCQAWWLVLLPTESSHWPSLSYFFILCVQVFCLQYVCVLCGSLVSIDTKRECHLMELELELVVSHVWMLGIDPGQLNAGTARALNCWAIYQPQVSHF